VLTYLVTWEACEEKTWEPESVVGCASCPSRPLLLELHRADPVRLATVSAKARLSRSTAPRARRRSSSSSRAARRTARRPRPSRLPPSPRRPRSARRPPLRSRPSCPRSARVSARSRTRNRVQRQGSSQRRAWSGRAGSRRRVSRTTVSRSTAAPCCLGKDLGEGRGKGVTRERSESKLRRLVY